MRYFSAIPVLIFAAQLISCTPKEGATGAQVEYDAALKMSLRRAYEFERLKDPATGEIPKGIKARELAFVSRLPKAENDRGTGWVRRGPFNIGGRTRALALDVTNESNILAGGVTGGMWRSTDGGESWVKTTASSDIHSVNCIVQDSRPGHENVWYYGTGEEFYGVVSGTSFTSLFSGDGMFKSIDGGESWFPLASTQSGTPQSNQDNTYDHVWRIIADHTQSEEDVVLAAVYNGIIRSTDGGETWQEVLGFNTIPSQFTDLLQTSDGIFYAVLSADGLGRGVYRSEDGIVWTQLDFPLGGSYRRIVMATRPWNENVVYFLLEGPSNQNGINHALFRYTYLSGDGTGEGGEWTELSGNLPQTPCVLNIGSDFDFGTFQSQGSYDLCIAHHPTENTLYIGGTNIFRSTDAFVTNDNIDWIGGYQCNTDNPRDYSYPNHHSDQHVFVFSPSNPNVMYNANDGGVYRTDDCLADSVSWARLNRGYITTQFYTVAMEQGLTTSEHLMGGMQDNGTWNTRINAPGENWYEAHNDDGAHCAIPEGADFVIVSSQLGRMYKKQLDENGSPVNARRIDPINGPSSLFINPFILDPVNHNTIYMAGGKTIWKLENLSDVEMNGEVLTPYPNEAWENISGSFIGFNGGSITALDMARGDHSSLFYGSTTGRLWKLDNLFGDVVRTELSSELWPNNAYVSSISVNDLNTQEIVVSFSNYSVISIYRTVDGGSSWEQISGNLEENQDGSGAGPAVYSVEIYPSDPPVYFAGTSAGLFSTEELNGSLTQWTMESPEHIGNVVINMIASRPYDGSIAVATHGNGIYTSNLTPVAAVNAEGATPLDFAFNVYPNPYISSFQLRVNPEKEGPGILRLFDMNGRLVLHQSLGFIRKGKQEISIEFASALAEGTYIAEINIGNFSSRRKLLKTNK
jgi:photosystem II stability/assembly factor-like uncharacterized protein